MDAGLKVAYAPVGSSSPPDFVPYSEYGSCQPAPDRMGLGCFGTRQRTDYVPRGAAVVPGPAQHRPHEHPACTCGIEILLRGPDEQSAV